ncbi:hypothetical protein JCM8547_004568 [Rhodosporidiobolus lusitaniae]
MIVHIVGSACRVILEDQGAFLSFDCDEGGQARVRWCPPGGEKPDLDGRNPALDARGCLGALRLAGTTFLLIAVPPVDPVGGGASEVEQLEEVRFFDLNGKHLPFAHTRKHPCYHLHRLFTSRTFYYSKSFDITTRLENRVKLEQHRNEVCTPQSRVDGSAYNTPFFLTGTREFTWNHLLLEPLRLFRDTLDPHSQSVFDSRFFILPVIQGFYGSAKVQVGGQTALLHVVSRRGWERAGTRFKKRGVDDRGNVGNFAEMETILETGLKTVAFTQVRGSVPLKWEEELCWKGPVDLHIDEPLLAVSLEPFFLHFCALLRSYSKVHILSLLSNLETGPLAAEAQLGNAYKALCGKSASQDPRFAQSVAYEQYSIHKEEILSGQAMRLPQELGDDVKPELDEFGVTIATTDGTTGRTALEKEQKGVFRVNCRDVLDRTNLAAFSLSCAALNTQLDSLGFPVLAGSELEVVHRKLFAQNGDALSQIYAGSPAMNSQFVRTGAWSTTQNLENAYNSEKRKEQCLLHDKEKNKAIEILTGQYRKQLPPPVFIQVDEVGQPVINASSPSSSPADTPSPSSANLSSPVKISPAAVLNLPTSKGPVRVRVFRIGPDSPPIE